MAESLKCIDVTNKGAAKIDNSDEHIENVIGEDESYSLHRGDNGIRGIISSPYVCAAALLASMGGFAFGYDQGVISLILTMHQFHNQYPETAPGHPGQGFFVGFMTGMLELGAFIGCLFYPAFADRYSRKWGLSFAVVWYCIGAIIQTAAPDYGTLVAGRTIGGVGVGTLALGAPLYISEISPPNLRGSLMVLEQLSIVVGAVAAYWITYGTAVIPSSWAFRLPFALQVVPALMVGIGIHFFPFSPRWLCMRDRQEDSLQALCKLRRLPRDDDRIRQELRGITGEVQAQQQALRNKHPDASAVKLEFLSWVDLFRADLIRPTMVAVAIPFFQQFSGITAFVYYAPTLFRALGKDDHTSLILSGMINICQLVGAVITLFFLIDRLGRRPLTIWGGFGMSIPHGILAGLVGTFSSAWSLHQTAAWTGVAMIYIYVLVYGVSYGPIGWTLPAEVYPNTVRAKGVGLAVAVNWISNFVIGVAVPPMVQSIGFGTYIFFSFWCFLAGIFSYFFVPETANLTLEEVEQLFKNQRNENSNA